MQLKADGTNKELHWLRYRSTIYSFPGDMVTCNTLYALCNLAAENLHDTRPSSFVMAYAPNWWVPYNDSHFVEETPCLSAVGSIFTVALVRPLTKTKRTGWGPKCSFSTGNMFRKNIMLVFWGGKCVCVCVCQWLQWISKCGNIETRYQRLHDKGMLWSLQEILCSSWTYKYFIVLGTKCWYLSVEAMLWVLPRKIVEVSGCWLRLVVEAIGTSYPWSSKFSRNRFLKRNWTLGGFFKEPSIDPTQG